MFGLNHSEMILYTGVAVMVADAVLFVLSMLLFWISKKKLKRQLNKEYGEKTY